MDGRTPLMEAALWGGLENVRTLSNHGADRDKICACRGKRMRAADFARSLDRYNREERFTRTRAGKLYTENTYLRDLDRASIFRLLSGGPEVPPPARLTLSSFTFTRTMQDRAGLMTLIAKFDMPKESKTVGMLYRGEKLPPVAALSGWTHGNGTSVRIGGEEWTGKVLGLCDSIGFPLQLDSRDQGVPGQFHATHAEKQLVALFVNKHVFLRQEVGQGLPDVSELSLSELSGAEKERRERDKQHKEKLFKLKKLTPPLTLKRATILVSRPVCWDCPKFVEFVNYALSLELTVFHRCLNMDGVPRMSTIVRF
ncbi:hypothetical protein CMUS01_14389 [Colletotrichum musicola]|uniref:Single-strand DNA deaminase toxin A-like C-terminal domain-containing protein n=1 Tax=Colletotrichum musicola TaxID=2175873 RepID=A0A8H6J4V0_9PEZI|nr:hypothetical protein CMUS01_14389 [Colletotrichum musicola]